MAKAGPEPDALRRRTIVSGLAALGARASRSALLLGGGVILARLLTPEEFGVFAMVVPMGVLAHGFTDQSFQTTLLQRQALPRDDVSALFWFAARVNVLMAAAMIAAGFALAEFYGEPRVVRVAAVWAAMACLLTLTGFQEALLKRDLRFPAVLLVELVAVAISVAVSIGLAVHGAGYWTLPIQVVVMDGCRGVGIHLVSGWLPGRPANPNPESVAAMRRSWRALVGLTVASWVNDQPDLVAVGRVGGAPVVGLYDTSRRWSWYPFAEPFFAVTDVAVTAFSRVQGNPARFKSIVTRAVLVMLTVSMPAIALTGVEAPSVVRVLLGPQWTGAVPFMRLLSVAAFAGSLARVCEWIYLSQGKAHRLLKWSLLIRTPVIGAAVLVGLTWGPLGVAAGVAVAMVLLALPAIGYCVRGTSLAMTDILQPAARPALASLAAAAAVAAIGGALPPTPGLERLGAALVVYAAAFLGSLVAIPGGRAVIGELVAGFRELRTIGKP